MYYLDSGRWKFHFPRQEQVRPISCSFSSLMHFILLMHSCIFYVLINSKSRIRRLSLKCDWQRYLACLVMEFLCPSVCNAFSFVKGKVQIFGIIYRKKQSGKKKGVVTGSVTAPLPFLVSVGSWGSWLKDSHQWRNSLTLASYLQP